jgi:hypothetical protein
MDIHPRPVQRLRRALDRVNNTTSRTPFDDPYRSLLVQEERTVQDLSREHFLDELAKGLANGAVQRRRDTMSSAAIDGRRVRTSFFLVGLSVLFVLALGACGGGGGGGEGADDGSAAPEAETEATTTMETTAAAAAPGTLPEQGGPLPAGEYETAAFEPAFSFRVGEGWDVPFPDLPDVVVLGVEGTQGASSVGFATPKEVFDPSKPAEEVAVPAPETADGWVAWLRDHPYLDAGEPTPASVGGVEGTRLDAVLSPVPEDYPEGCEEPCVPGWRVSDPATAFDFYPGEKVRITVLEIEGEPVLVTAAAPEEEFEGFLPEAQEVLDTVEWGSQ